MREHVDLPTVEALRREWRRNPPVHHLVAAYLEYKAPIEIYRSASADPDPEVDGLMSQVGDLVQVQRLERPIDTSAFDAAMAEAARKRELAAAAAR